MTTYEFLNANQKMLLHLISVGKVIKGRKKLQKIVYILKKLGIPFSEKFKLYHFGPYSIDLQLEVDELVSLGMVDEKWEGNLCVYCINNRENSLKESSLIRADIVNILNEKDTSLLELLSTYLYLIEMEGDEEIAKMKLKIIKPHIFFRFEEALTLWNQLNTKNLGEE